MNEPYITYSTYGYVYSRPERNNHYFDDNQEHLLCRSFITMSDQYMVPIEDGKSIYWRGRFPMCPICCILSGKNPFGGDLRHEDASEFGSGVRGVPMTIPYIDKPTSGLYWSLGQQYAKNIVDMTAILLLGDKNG